MIIYRLENIENGNGVYQQPPTRLKEYFEEHGELYNTDKHPQPFEDGISVGEFAWRYTKHKVEIRFGFKNRKQLQRWFHKEAREKIQEYNPKIHIIVYKINEDDVSCGDRQLIFNKYKAEKISVLDVVTLKEIWCRESETEDSYSDIFLGCSEEEQNGGRNAPFVPDQQAA